MSESTSAQRSAAGRIGAHVRWSREDPVPQMAKARAGLQARFEREVDPNGVLDPAERARRAEHARKAFYQRLQLKSAKARASKAARRARAATRT